MLTATKLFYDNRRKVVCDVLDQYPDLPSRTLARLLHHNYKLMFPSIEDARDAVRYIRGTHGDANRRTLKDRKYVTA